MIRRPELLALLMLFLVTAPALAATRHVPSAYPTIQAAANAASPGDTIMLACGVYYEHDIVVQASVAIGGAGANPSCAEINFEDSDGLLYTGPGTVRLFSLTLTNGHPALSHEAAEITNVVFYSNGMQGLGVDLAGPSTVTDCAFISNVAEGSPLHLGNGTFTRCVFDGNDANNSFCAISFGNVDLQDCEFYSNRAFVANAVCAGQLSMDNCVFVNNGAESEFGYTAVGGAVSAGNVSASRCVFYNNYVGLGDYTGGAIGASGSATIDRCIFVSNSGPEIIACDGPNATISVTCSNIWGNPESNWDGCISGQLGINGNISVDPKFCNPAGNDFHLSSISPCLDAACGPMGAFGLGCYDQSPGIISINDVGNDQGRHVRLTWYRSLHDAPGDVVNGYAIYRRKDLYAAALAPTSNRALNPAEAALLGWDYLATVPRRFDDEYQYVAPTLCDSAIASGQCWSAFFVSALTPSTFYDSPVDSGYSKDNLPPPTPTNFAVNFNTGSGNHLAWNAVAAGDFAGFRIYRGTLPGFLPSDATLVQSTTQTSWTDPSFDGWNLFYKIAAFDIAGNQSVPASAGTVTGAESPRVPLTLSLGPNVPNPFNPTTRIPFVIPSAGLVRLAIYDVSGALVRVLVDRPLPLGGSEAVWDGRDSFGNAASSGIYLLRLEHASGTELRKIALLK